MSQIAADTTIDCSHQHPIKGKLTASTRNSPSLNNSFIDDAVFKHIFMHIFLSDFLIPADLNSLNIYYLLFAHFYCIMLNINHCTVCKLFLCDKDCTYQSSAPPECCLQLLFMKTIY